MSTRMRQWSSIGRAILTLLMVGALAAPVFAAGSQEGAEQEQSLSYNLVNELGGIDPGLAVGLDQSRVNYSLFEGLVKIDPELNIVPGVAERWDISDDGRTYTFYLREDATWSDGESVTAEDFEWSWLRVIDPATASAGVGDYFILENAEAYNNGQATRDEVGVEAIDDRTLEVTLAAPSPVFLQDLIDQVFLPVRRDVVEQDPEGWSTRPDIFIGNGPFTLEAWRPRDAIVVRKNEN